MARRKNRGNWEQDEPGLDISSLIDVCFLLLIYFLIATSIIKNEQDVNMRLPSSAPSDVNDPTQIQPLFIKILESGAIYVGPGDSAVAMDTDITEHSVPLLTSELETYKAACDLASAIPVIQVKIEPEVKQQRVLDVLNSISSFKIDRVTFTDFAE